MKRLAVVCQVVCFQNVLLQSSTQQYASIQHAHVTLFHSVIVVFCYPPWFLLGARQDNILGSVWVRLCLCFTSQSAPSQTGSALGQTEWLLLSLAPWRRGKGVHPGAGEDEIITVKDCCSITFVYDATPPPSLFLTQNMSRFSP